ncbi:low affinity iron permease [Hirsutella rhossiliensis]|uniref:Low affinity iron permease domain-containing protein n=1 Tax=Hirsutella rhossiliensis TaxID=111463 RepID=A0A9P8MSM6_9HYPO|nr:low affinity iron permease domain-containing protein [Hirsutella rhossiliensis]KAH0959486.1 low affinity iron permease domain-containing protein [Hirsutella rhossiliensis]
MKVNNASNETGKEAFPSGEPALTQNASGYVEKSKDQLLERWLDWVVKASGSEPVFLIILVGLLLWAFLGIRYGQSSDWAVIISDVQAIVSYVFDSLLMRQQLNGYEKMLRVSAGLSSRNISLCRMLRKARSSGRYEAARPAELGAVDGIRFEFPTENLVGRVSTLASRVLGHFVTLISYWVCIFIWIGFGPYCNWSNRWQLYINSATSALMVLIFAFLANIRERHDNYIESCQNILFEVDCAVELRLRTITGDDTPNETVVIPAPKLSRIQRAIFYYADLVGTLTGIAILMIVIAIWIAIGPLMSFNSNWWLLIGTYAGLVGLHDGFVLRNVQMQFDNYADEALEKVASEDKSILADIGMQDQANSYTPQRAVVSRLSAKMGAICSHEMTVMLGVVFIIGLLAGASAMKWTTTGQLLCNVPPSIIESFVMMILITGHNLAEAKRREEIHQMYLRRVKLLAYVEGLAIGDGKTRGGHLGGET